jgi:hypothetical protein
MIINHLSHRAIFLVEPNVHFMEPEPGALWTFSRLISKLQITVSHMTNTLFQIQTLPRLHAPFVCLEALDATVSR